MNKRYGIHVLLSGLVVLSALAFFIGDNGKVRAAVVPAEQYPLGNVSTSIAVGDFNGDGHPDLAVASYGVKVLMNKGDGTFAPSVEYNVGSQAISVVVGDFNGDGQPDIAAVTRDGGNSQIAILLNSGNGTFAPPVMYPGEHEPSQLIAADLNKDGHLDLAIAGYVGISVLINNGDGTFGAEANYLTGQHLAGLAVGDFQGDGYPDLVTVNSGTMIVLRNNKDGTFGREADYSIGIGLISVTTGDFNKDGYTDVAMTDSQGNVIVTEGYGNGTFAPRVSYAIGGSYILSLVVADFNADGYPDLLVVQQNEVVNKVVVLLNKGDGTFTKGPVYHVGNGETLAVADFNGDGQADLAVGGYPNLTVLLLEPLPDLAISNTNQGGKHFVVGEKVRYTLTVSSGSQAGMIKQNKAIVVTDTISAGLDRIAVQGTGWQISLNGTGSSVTSPAVITALYIGAYPVKPGQVLPPLMISGVVTKDAVPGLKTTARVVTKNDSNGKNNLSVDVIHVKAAA